jgi:hypothetical protein
MADYTREDAIEKLRRNKIKVMEGAYSGDWEIHIPKNTLTGLKLLGCMDYLVGNHKMRVRRD